MHQFHGLLLIFAGILIYGSAKFFVSAIFGGDDDEEEDPGQNSIVRFSSSLIDSTNQFDGDRFFTLVDGVRKATPLFICMVAVEISDVVFAVDSIPAVFGVTEVRSLKSNLLIFYAILQLTFSMNFYTAFTTESIHCVFI